MGRKTENTGFVCINCGADVPPIAAGTCRNHCPRCLFSLHLDVEMGDRQSDCGGLMRPLAIAPHSKKGPQILHKCDKCGHKRKNMLADDDDVDAVAEIMRNAAYKTVI